MIQQKFFTPFLPPPFAAASNVLEDLKALLRTHPLSQELLTDEPVEALRPWVEKFQQFQDILILGTGGSSLGGQALYALKTSVLPSPRLHFIETIDSEYFAQKLALINPQNTGVIAISKSGNTPETLLQTLLCLQHWRQNHLAVQKHFLFLTQPEEEKRSSQGEPTNLLRSVALSHKIDVLDHPKDIGGRYAVFTSVGLLPLWLSSLDPWALRLGARQQLHQILAASSPQECPPLQAALHLNSLAAKGITEAVMMPYRQALVPFSFWYRQLWAESLGKNGKGITPVLALGPVDQHSQLQLYLDGPRNKFFTFLAIQTVEKDHTVQEPQESSLKFLENVSLNQLLAAEEKATREVLSARAPTRLLTMERFSEETCGALMMHFFAETLSMALLWSVNPFDQPAVEQGKKLALRYLSSAL